MSENPANSKPLLASLVNSGDQQTEAIAITDSIFMAKDISNAYLVTTNDGDVMVNCGFMGSTERNKAIFAPVRRGELKAIVITQAHPDHYGGVPAFMEADTHLITGALFNETCGYFGMLGDYFKRRSGKLWSGTIKGRDLPVPSLTPDVGVEDSYGFSVGGKRFEVITTPGGESLDAVSVWLPDEGTVFTGNLFGPVFMSMPNLCTMRGDKPRSAKRYLDSLDRVRQLNPELLITGHGEPIRGATAIRADLDKLYNAVSYVHDTTVAGMNRGADVYTLMDEIRLPEHLQLGEFHGKVSWAVRTIWEEYSGWFHQDSTTAMYAVPRSSVDDDLLELAGGPDSFATRAQHKLNEHKPLEALHLLDIVLGAQPSHRESLEVKKLALEQLLRASGGNNLSEVMWLKTEISATEAAIRVDQGGS